MFGFLKLERQLKAAEACLKVAIAALAPKHEGGDWAEYQSAHQEVLQLKRKIAAEKGDEYAEYSEAKLSDSRVVPVVIEQNASFAGQVRIYYLDHGKHLLFSMVPFDSRSSHQVRIVH